MTLLTISFTSLVISLAASKRCVRTTVNRCSSEWEDAFSCPRSPRPRIMLPENIESDILLPANVTSSTAIWQWEWQCPRSLIESEYASVQLGATLWRSNYYARSCWRW